MAFISTVAFTCRHKFPEIISISSQIQYSHGYQQCIKSSIKCAAHLNFAKKKISFQSVTKSPVSNPLGYFCLNRALHVSSVNLKSKKKNQRNKNEDNDIEENMVGIEDDEEGVETNSSKVMYLKVSSLRLDMILKSAFQIARNKIEMFFYQSKIRVNGYKVLKKSHSVSLGDEIDIIKGFSTVNPEFLVVQRLKILAASDTLDEDNGTLTLKIRRYKSLTINNYEEDEYKESASASEN